MSAQAAAAQEPLPEPDRVDTEGPNHCALIAFGVPFTTPQTVGAAFAGPQKGTLERDTLRSDGTEVDAGDIVEGVAGVTVTNGGCGLSVKVELDTRVCKRKIFFTDCEWETVASNKYIYDEVPTNGVRVFPRLYASLRDGEHSYRMKVVVNAMKLEFEQPGDPQLLLRTPRGAIKTGAHRGAILSARENSSTVSETVRLEG